MPKMIQSMRWFGPQDPVSLADIRQTGATEVVTALHHIPVGEIWTENAIQERKNIIEAAHLQWTVVESLPVHTDIKLKKGRYQEWIENYQTSLQNLARHGIRVVTYNFMPLFDWIRTDLSFALPQGSQSLYFSKREAIAFGLEVLQRQGAEKPFYTEEEKEEALTYYHSLSENQKQALSDSILLGLPGTMGTFGLEEIRNAFDAYKDIDSERYRTHFIYFLEQVVPTAQDCGTKLAIHPDDPPFPLFGLPRVVSTADDIRKIVEAVDMEANGLCFCTGSLGVREENHLEDMIQRYGDRIHFAHLRNIKRLPNGDFYESAIFQGSVDMYGVVKTLCDIMQKRNVAIPMRPDHGHQMLDDLQKNTYPGYSAIGRLKSLAELRGLEMGIMGTSVAASESENKI
ncbi:MAG: mannonate dehydratase [Chitinophagaceae bacterium]